jgi:acyl carrier protein
MASPISSEEASLFLSSLAELLELEAENLGPNTSFASLDWDSLAIISTIALADEHFGVVLSGDKLAQCKGIPDVLELISSLSPA